MKKLYAALLASITFCLFSEDFDAFQFIKGREIYAETTIMTALHIDGVHHGVTETGERTVLKITGSTAHTGTFSGISYIQQKIPYKGTFAYKTIDEYRYTYTKDRSGAVSGTSLKSGVSDYPVLPLSNINPGDEYIRDAHYRIPLRSKQIPDLIFDIRFVYRFLGESNSTPDHYVYTVNGTVVQDRKNAFYQKYGIAKITGFSSSKILFNRPEGLVHSIEETFDWILILSDATVLEYSGTSLTRMKTPPPLPSEDLINVIKTGNEITLNRDLLLSVNIENIQFKPDSARLEETELSRIDSVVEELRTAGVTKFIIAGHTANVGDPELQLKLSEQRAKSVYDYIITKHIFSPDTISWMGKGGRSPLDTNTTEEGRERNRRVEFIILPDN